MFLNHIEREFCLANFQKGSTGPLILTEEEKRTLLSEGYPVPQRLPLTKQEEKSLKKIRRKIKNKVCARWLSLFYSSRINSFLQISAQESRRKKKEYMDCLERKMDSLHTELSQYKTRQAVQPVRKSHFTKVSFAFLLRCFQLEDQNSTLISQVRRLQAQLATATGGGGQVATKIVDDNAQV